MTRDLNRRELLLRSAATLVAALARGRNLYAAASAKTAPDQWVHPGVFQRRSDLAFMKAQVLAGHDPWKTAWDQMLALPTSSSMDFDPNPFTHIVRGSYGAGQRGDRELNESLEAAESHVLQWVVTEREEHARKSADILDAWAATLADFSGNDAMLLGGWTGGKWANVAEILRATWPGWQRDRVRRFEHMLKTVYVSMLTPFFPEANGNWDAALMHSLLAIAVFCEDRPLLDHVVKHYRFGSGSSGITRYVYPNVNARRATETRRTRNWVLATSPLRVLLRGTKALTCSPRRAIGLCWGSNTQRAIC